MQPQYSDADDIEPCAPATDAARPTLSILCPTYNRRRFLERFLKHHVEGFAKIGMSVEILVSDNGSSDGSRDHARAVSQDHPHVRLVEQPVNLGAYGNVLYTYRRASGRYAAYLGDDDLLVPEQVASAIRWMDENPDCVMWQAPWVLLDETRGNAEMGQFYQIGAPRLFAPNQHGACLDFVLKHHIFPESYILRTDAIPHIVAPMHDHAFVFFVQLSRALEVGSVMFSPEPFARMTAVTAGDNSHVGNSEVMIGWDRYRGGLEYMAARAREGDAGALGDMPTFLLRMQQFVCQRMAVAVRMHRAAGNWRDAHYLIKRLAAYGVALPDTPDMKHLQTLAAFETCLREAGMLQRAVIVLDPRVPETFLDNLNPSTRPPVVRPSDAAGPEPKAHIVLGGSPDWEIGPDDVVIDLAATFSQYL